jgi:hypothetical protein
LSIKSMFHEKVSKATQQGIRNAVASILKEKENDSSILINYIASRNAWHEFIKSYYKDDFEKESYVLEKKMTELEEKLDILTDAEFLLEWEVVTHQYDLLYKKLTSKFFCE